MYNFLMVSTVLSKKQFTILSVKKEDLATIAQEMAKGRNHLILYPCVTNKNVKDVSDLISTDDKKQLFSEVKTNNPKDKKLSVKNFTGFKLTGVLSIEALDYGMFRIRTEEGSFLSNSFELF